MSFSNDLAYDLVPQIGSAARLGLIALSTDETVEDELHMARPAGDIAIFTARIASAAEVTRANLADIGARGLPHARCDQPRARADPCLRDSGGAQARADFAIYRRGQRQPARHAARGRYRNARVCQLQ